MKRIFHFSKDYKNLDYISCWFYLASSFINKSGAQAAFVSTNSIVQGDQVSLLWQHIFDQNIEISFAHRSFKWENSAKGKAAVICVIVGLRRNSSKECFIYNDYFKFKTSEIGPYLNSGNKLIVCKARKPLNGLPEMIYGNMPLEGGFLKLSKQEMEDLVQQFPEAKKYIRPTIGGEEFLKGIKRWCIWINDEEIDDALRIPALAERIQNVRNFRVNGGEVARTLVGRPHQFRYRHEAEKQMMVVPCTSSENRDYLQCGFFTSEYISMNSIQVILDPELWLFSVLSSKMHMIWVKSFAGRLKSDYRYSNVICYNTFPCPSLTSDDKNTLADLAVGILTARENHSGSTIGNLYKKGEMPQDLLLAHEALDEYFEQLYTDKKLQTEEERLEVLLNEYTKMTGGHNA